MLGDDVRLDPGALRALSAHDWPGNLRELRATLRAARTLAPGTVVRAQDLPALVPAFSARHYGTLHRIEMETIVDAVRAAGGNKHQAAQQLGISRSTLYRRLRDFERG